MFLRLCAALAASCPLIACETASQQGDVRYGSPPGAIGQWQPEDLSPEMAVGGAGTMGVPPPSSPPSSDGEGSAPTGSPDRAGSDAPMITAGSNAPPVDPAQGSAGTGAVNDEPQAGSDAPAQGSDLAVNELRFEVLTKSLGGKYSPKNVGAIWIEDGSGVFVKTLEVWAAKRERYLSRFRNEAQGNRVDAVASATLRSHVSHSASWDLTDVSGQLAAPGDYKVVVEITDHDGPGDSAEVPFTLGDPSSLTPNDATHFVDMTLTVQ